ncbi:MAG: hypothetical protein ACE5E8_02610 [Acidimicrobiia bacterium]
MKRLLPMLVGMVLITTACKAEINYGFELNQDGSGSIVAEFGFDEEFLQLLEGQDPFEGNALAETPGAVAEQFTRGEFTFYKVTVPVDDVAQLDQQAADADSPFGDAFEVSVDNDKATFHADLSQRFIEETTGGGQSSLEGTDLSLEDVFQIHIRVKLPGKVTSHNAARTVDGFLEWDVPLDGAPLVMDAVSDPSRSGGGDGGGFPVWIIILIVAVVAAGGFYLYNQSQHKGVAGGEPPTPPDAPPVPEPPSLPDAPTAPAGGGPEGES